MTVQELISILEDMPPNALIAAGCGDYSSHYDVEVDLEGDTVSITAIAYD